MDKTLYSTTPNTNASAKALNPALVTPRPSIQEKAAPTPPTREETVAPIRPMATPPAQVTTSTPVKDPVSTAMVSPLADPPLLTTDTLPLETATAAASTDLAAQASAEISHSSTPTKPMAEALAVPKLVEKQALMPVAEKIPAAATIIPLSSDTAQDNTMNTNQYHPTSLSPLTPDNESYLSDLEFSDLMLWPDGRAFLRHVVGYQGPIVAVPAPYQQDVERIWALIRSEKREREFFLIHDGVPYRVARVDTVEGSGYFMRRPKYPVPELESLGLEPAMVATLRCMHNYSGMILIAGATGSGKTTTLYSLLTELVNNTGDIAVAVEDPPEIPVQGVYGERGQGLWYQIDAASAGGFETAMIAAMRYNPRYILLGEIRAPKVANEAIRAAVNGHLVLATIHGNSLPGAILALQQIAAAGAGSLDLARSILGDGMALVMHQELRADPDHPGKRQMHADMLCFGNEHGLRAKLRGGKLELLNNDIDAQRMRIARGLLPVDL